MCSAAHSPRRDFLRRLGVGSLLLTPLAAVLSACGKSGWPEGMAEIKWDRDTCVRCSMVISDRRFAAEVRGGPKDQVFKFDDPGCLAFWLRDKAGEFPWLADATTRFWIADISSKTDAMKWLAPHKAQYVSKTSPMGYNFGATGYPQAGSLDFESMREHVLAKGK